jgi:tetratricopeptide (TPR) repeat protein
MLLVVLISGGRALAAGEGEAYLEVGEAEGRAGQWKTAALALERAASLLPRSWRTAAALGTAYARLGRLAKAQAELERARALGDDRALTLLELGIVLVRRGSYAEARAPLRLAAARARETEVRGAARFFESLADFRLGDTEAARRGFAEAEKGGGTLAESARRMRVLAQPLARLSLQASVRGEYDSNALLLPGTPSTIPLPAPEADAALALTMGLRGRPLPGVDLVLRDEIVYREQRTVDELDFFGNVAGIDYRRHLGLHLFTAGYQLEYYRLAGAPYLLSPRAGLGYEHRVSEGVRVAASFALQLRRFQQAAFDPFSGEGLGWRVGAVLLGPPSAWTVEAGYAPALELTQERDLGFHGHAFFASLAWEPRSFLSLSVGGEVALRFFLAADEVIGETRRELQPVAWASLLFRPVRPWRILLSAYYTRNAARPAFYEYDRIVISLGTSVDIDLL